jgi:hypothetical protein
MQRQMGELLTSWEGCGEGAAVAYFKAMSKRVRGGSEKSRRKPIRITFVRIQDRVGCVTNTQR